MCRTTYFSVGNAGTNRRLVGAVPSVDAVARNATLLSGAMPNVLLSLIARSAVVETGLASRIVLLDDRQIRCGPDGRCHR